MTSVTDPDFLPYGTPADFGDVQQWYELASRVDAWAQAADQAFNNIYRPKAFLIRGTGTLALGTGYQGSTLGSYWNTTDWNTSGGRMPGAGTPWWYQDAAEPPSWWLLGANISLTNTAGTPSTSTKTEMQFNILTTDPVTGKNAFLTTSTSGRYSGFRENIETNSGGESMSIATVAPIYQGQVSSFVQVFPPSAGDTASRTVAAQGQFWGVRLGKVYL